MFKKILLTFFVVILICGAVVGYLYYKDLKKPVSPSIDAIPTNACFIIETRNTQKTWDNIIKTNLIWNDLKATNFFGKLNRNFIFLDSVISTNPSLEEVFETQSLFVSCHEVTQGTFDYLYTINTNNIIDEATIDEVVKENTDKSSFVSQRTFEGIPVNEIKMPNSKEVFSYARVKGNFVASFSAALLEASIKQTLSGKSLVKQSSFSKVYGTIGSNVDGNLYINYPQFSLIANKYFSDNAKIRLSNIAGFADWSAFDLKVSPNAFAMNGFTLASDSLNNYLSIFKKQNAQSVKITTSLPDKTASFLFYGLSNFKSFRSEYKNYLQKNKSDKVFTDAINNINQETGENIETIFDSFISNEIAVVNATLNSKDSAESTFVVLGTNSVENALSELTKISEEKDYTRSKEVKEEDGEKDKGSKKEKKDQDKKENTEKSDKKKSGNDEENADNEEAESDSLELVLPEKPAREFKIKKIKAQNIFNALLGESFSGLTNNYYACVNDYIVFANSPKALNDYYKAIKDGKILSKSESYTSFANNVASEANIFVYINIQRSKASLYNQIAPVYLADMLSYSDLYSKFEALALQISTKKDLYYTSLYLKHNPSYKNESNSLWEIALDAPISSKPKIVTNHLDGTKEVIVQDEDNNLYLINNKGEILWKTELAEKIESEIFQVDKLKNDKLQYVFNTRNKLYMIDRKGKNVEGYPVELKHPATSPLTVFDYEKNREYRFMIACENNRLYNFSPDGQPVNGWEFTIMESKIAAQPQHFIINDKDYIVVVSVDGTIKIVDRKGKSIVEVSEKLMMNKDQVFYLDIGKDIFSTRLIATDNNGLIQFVYFSNKLEKKNIKSFSSDHHFDYKDIDNDQKREFIFTDKNELYVFDESGTQVFVYKTKSNITQKPLYFLFPDGRAKIGLVNATTKQIYLVNNKGAVERGFPKYGSTGFSIGDINDDNKFNIVVGSADQHIYTYPLEE